MIILDCPSNIEDYIMADGDLAWRLHQAGFTPKYKDDDVLYFKKSNKLEKFIKKLENKTA